MSTNMAEKEALREKAGSSPQWPFATDRPRPVPVVALVALALMLAAWNVGLVFFAFRDPQRWCYPAWRLAQETGGLFNLTLSANLLNFAVFVVGLLMLGLKQRPTWLGLDLKRLPAGVAATLAIFALAETTQAAAAWALGEPIVLSESWSRKTWTASAGVWIAQLFGNAFFEEVMYRGFFLPQTYLLAALRLNRRPVACLAVALVLSQGVFTAIHLPVNAAHDVPPIFLLVQFAIGLVLAGLYLASGNLFLVMGIHAIVNEPPSLVLSHLPEGLVPGLLTLGLLLVLIMRRTWKASGKREIA